MKYGLSYSAEVPVTFILNEEQIIKLGNDFHHIFMTALKKVNPDFARLASPEKIYELMKYVLDSFDPKECDWEHAFEQAYPSYQMLNI